MCVYSKLYRLTVMVKPLRRKFRGRNDTSLPINLLDMLSYRVPVTPNPEIYVYYIVQQNM